jgi:hypothetical protein
MAHCPPALLGDLAAVLAEVRTWPGVIDERVRSGRTTAALLSLAPRA